MTKADGAEEIIRDLRNRMEDSFTASGQVLMNALDALSIGPRINSPFELVMSPVWGYHWSSLYAGIARATQAGHSVDRLRRERLDWLRHWSEQLEQDLSTVSGWRLRVLDATNYDRPQTETVRLGYVHGCEGMRVGHALSILSARVEEGSWHLPLETAVIPVEESPTQFGARQVVAYVEAQGWQPDELLAVDAQYTNAPTLKPLHERGVNVLGRVSSKRNFYLPPSPYAGRGRPRVRGKKMKLCDGRTIPESDQTQWVAGADGRSYEVSQWTDVRMQKWPEQALCLYRVIEYGVDGTRRYQRPLWLLYVGSNAAPHVTAVHRLYGERFGIEHSLRFQKGEIGLVAGQFNGPEATERVQLWVEMVATVLWLLFAARRLVHCQGVAWPAWWKSRKLTPGTMRRLAGGVLLKLRITAPQPQVRGKSAGRAKGQKFEPRRKYRIYRKRKRHASHPQLA